MKVVSNNRSLSGGINTRTAGREIAPNEATSLQNADISTPGLRTKRLEPEPVATLTLNDLPVQTICPTTVQVPPVEVFWVDGVGESGYRVELFGGAGCVPSQLIHTSPDLPINTTSYVIPADAFSIILNEYSWHVVALGNGSTTSDTTSDCCLLTISTAIPPCVDLGQSTPLSPIDNVDILCNPVVFTWTAVPNAIGYIIRIYVSGDNTPAHSSPVLPASQTNYIQTLVLGQSYDWTVQAIGDGQTWCNGAETDGDTFGANCAFTVEGTQVIGPCGSGLASVHVGTNGPNCSWTASESTSWITLTGQTTGTGDGDVPFSVSDNNTGSSRVGTITVEGQIQTITQTACAFTISPTADSFLAAGGTGSTDLEASGTCCTWTAVSNAAWIVVDVGDASGSGSATINYTVAANTTASARVGTVTIAGLTLTISQAAPVQPTVPDAIHWWDGEIDGRDIIGVADDTSFTTVAAGKVNNALSFNGSNLVSFNAATISDIPAAGGWTIEGWINLTDLAGVTGGQRQIVGFKGVTPNPSIGIYVEAGGGTLGVQWYAGGASFPTMNVGAISFLTWYHIAVTHNGTTARFYLNGVELDTEVAGSAVTFDTFNQTIGGNDSGGGNRFWKGLIDELTIFSRALTAAEVLSIYDAQSAGKVRP